MSQNFNNFRYQNPPHDLIGKSREPFLNRKDVARILGISVSSLRRWEKAGRIEKVRLTSRTIRFDPRDVDQILRENKIGRFR